MCNVQQKSIMEFCRSVSHDNEQGEETEGFDIQAGLTWIYPTNYPLRDYQFNIIQQALYKNTLVSLPTGLGKTFIAAVVMYNFYRWYPTGKIVFMAPTKPLVKQQVDACYDIMAIPQDVTAELTGMKQNSSRNDIWMEKRVFFVTPQVLQNDLDNSSDLGPAIKCIVVDEAHKARGNYSYCEVLRKLNNRTKYFRVLALSATPGNSIEDIGEVITNLRISHLEFRTEESFDVKPYVFQRKLEIIVVPLGEKLEQVKADYLEILERYARTLIKYKIIQGNYSTLTKGRIFIAKKEFQERNVRAPNYNEVMKTLNICMTLYHAYELLIRHGLRVFLSFFEEHIDKPLLRGNGALIRVVQDVRDHLGPFPDVEQLPDGSYPEVPSNVKFGHPKFQKLRDILVSHFISSEEDSRVIVFFEYRDSVKEAFMVLLQARPVIKAKIFLGQKSGITQRIQLNVIKSFRDGECNTLLSTCIGEEGLDVGEVDLIVCFDISNKSPIRMVQRMGRTGRKREGQVIVLVTEGKEQQTLNECLIHKKNLKHWAGSSELMRNFYVKSARMVPQNVSPQCVKMHITVRKPKITKGSTLKDMFRTITGGSSSSSILSDDIEIIEIKEKIPEPIYFFNKGLTEFVDSDLKPGYTKYLENQRCLQGGERVGSSDASNLFVSLMKLVDSKRFNIPLTQEAARESHNRNLKQGDIRSMFTRTGSKSNATPMQDDFTSQNSQHTSIKGTQDIIQTQYLKEVPKLNDKFKELHTEIANYLSIELTKDVACEICDRLFRCNIHNIPDDEKEEQDLKHWIPPDISIVQGITLDDLESYQKSMNTQSKSENKKDDSILELVENNDILSLFSDSKIEETKSKEKSFSFNAPKSFGDLLDTFNISSTHPTTELPAVASIDVESKSSKKGDLAELLAFFKLERIEDVFESLEGHLDHSSGSDRTICYTNTSPVFEFDDHLLSPVLSTQDRQAKEILENNESGNESGSPILGSRKKIRLSKKLMACRRNLNIIDTSIEENRANITQKTKEYPISFLKETQRNYVDSEFTLSNEPLACRRSLDIIDTSIEEISSKINKKSVRYPIASSTKTNKNCDESGITLSNKPLACRRSLDIFDTSVEDISLKMNQRTDEHLKFISPTKGADRSEESDQSKELSEDEILPGIARIKQKLAKAKESQRHTESLELEDFCDLSAFGLINTENDSEISKNATGVIVPSQKRQNSQTTLKSSYLYEKSMLPTAESNKYKHNENVPKEILQDSDKVKTSKKTVTPDLEINDICDLSIFGLTQQCVDDTTTKTLQEFDGITRRKKNVTPDLKINDICDLSIFGLTQQCVDDTTTKTLQEFDGIRKSQKSVSPELKINDICDLSAFGVTQQRKDKKTLGGETESSEKRTISDLKIDDICDLSSIFGLTLEPEDDSAKKDALTTPICPSKISDSNHFDETITEFTDFVQNFNNKFMSTQREININNESKILSDDQMKSTHEKISENNKSKNTNLPEVVAHSPDKENVIDLTLSPEMIKKREKRKIMSQLSITQVLSLAGKPTQSALSMLRTQSTQKSTTPNLNTSTFHDSEYIKDTNSKKIQLKPNGTQSSKNNVHNSSILDDLRNFEEFNQSFASKKPSPLFKRPDVTRRPHIQRRKQNLNVTPVASCSKMNKTFLTDSDDEFETSKNISMNVSRRKNETNDDSEDEFETTISPRKTSTVDAKRRGNKVKKSEMAKGNAKKKKKHSDFIEMEAEVSDEAISISDDEMSEDDAFEASFVDDETQNIGNDSQMRAKYLQSVRSPQIGPKFKIPVVSRPITADIFSQAVDPGEYNSYINDSFCVNTQDIDGESHNLSELEILEKKLKQMKKKKRKASAKNNNEAKRRRIVLLDSDSD